MRSSSASPNPVVTSTFTAAIASPPGRSSRGLEDRRAPRAESQARVGCASVVAGSVSADDTPLDAHRELLRRQREAEALARVGRLINETLDLTTVSQRIADSVLELLDV